MKLMKIKDHNELFLEQEYVEQFERKKEFENCPTAAEVQKIAEWTKTEDYKEELCEEEHKDQSCKGLPASGCDLLRVRL